MCVASRHVNRLSFFQVEAVAVTRLSPATDDVVHALFFFRASEIGTPTVATVWKCPHTGAPCGGALRRVSWHQSIHTPQCSHMCHS